MLKRKPNEKNNVKFHSPASTLRILHFWKLEVISFSVRLPRTWSMSGANADMEDFSFEVVCPSDFETQNQKSLEKTILKRKPNEKTQCEISFSSFNMAHFAFLETRSHQFQRLPERLRNTEPGIARKNDFETKTE